jgi:hypothetical protein
MLQMKKRSEADVEALSMRVFTAFASELQHFRAFNIYINFIYLYTPPPTLSLLFFIPFIESN